MRLIILVGMIIIGTNIAFALVGLVATDLDRRAEQTQMILAIIVGPTLGLFAGLGLLQLIRSKPRRKRSPHSPKPRRVAPLRPFKSRLAQYTHQSETEVMTHTEYQSKMPFWIAVEFLTNVPPKSAKAIRRVLERIRALVSETHC